MEFPPEMTLAAGYPAEATEIPPDITLAPERPVEVVTDGAIGMPPERTLAVGIPPEIDLVCDTGAGIDKGADGCLLPRILDDFAYWTGALYLWLMVPVVTAEPATAVTVEAATGCVAVW
jgi:hypothetical protein